MRWLADARMYARFMRGLGRYFRAGITPARAREMVAERLAHRGELFLCVARRGIYGYPRSPYLPLLRTAGIDYAELARMVRGDGLQGALCRLHDAGVYVTFEEFKGRAPITRHGRQWHVNSHDFDNPFLSSCYSASTGGSTGAGTRVDIDLDHATWQLPFRVLALEAYGLTGTPTVLWRPGLPAMAGLSHALRSAAMGNCVRRWFEPVMAGGAGASLRDRFATRYVVTAARLWGAPMPTPEPVPLGCPEPVLAYLRKLVRREGACLVRSGVSTSTRLCLAAAERGIDLTGCTFFGGSEPPTPSKVNAIRRSGARHIPVYASTEAGTIGVGCGTPVDENDIHLALDCLALVQRPRKVPGWQTSVDAFFLTSLSPASSKIMLNAGLDDYGLMERRECSCLLGRLGYDVHLRHIRSYGKLTGEGVTLVHTDVAEVLERDLPARFGGTAFDYQLVEEEDEAGRTRVVLLVDPAVELAEPERVGRELLQMLARGNRASHFAARLWQQSGAVRVRRQKPHWTAAGKFMPLNAPTGRKRLRKSENHTCPKQEA